jgi:hypothetical protein
MNNIFCTCNSFQKKGKCWHSLRNQLGLYLLYKINSLPFEPSPYIPKIVGMVLEAYEPSEILSLTVQDLETIVKDGTELLSVL